jgi:hypothetical protein
MKSYPKIPHIEGYYDLPCTAFYKYDGSNLRFEWSAKRGFYKFGTRTRLFDHTDEVFGPAIDIFKNTLAPDIEKVFNQSKLFRNAQQAIVFCEFFGPNSFAGQHVPEDPKKLVLFDVNIHKKGFISPVEFLDEFGHLGDKVAEMIYRGLLTHEFEQQVRSGVIPNLVEGVVVKGGTSPHKLWSCKIKTDAYREKLKQVYQEKWQDFWE